MAKNDPSPQDTESILYVDPSVVQADPADNVRFALRPSHIEQLANSIRSEGGVRLPLEVEPLEGVKGKKYRLMTGFGRHAAVSKLKEEGQAFLLPILVRPIGDETLRLKLQLSENLNRESLSMMDTAVAIRKLLDSGLSKTEVRQLFLRPGTKKGGSLTPVSNAWVNIVLRLLEMPKGIQEKVHSGLLSYSAVYQLGRVPADKRQAVLDSAEAEREKQEELEQKDEQRFLKDEQRAATASAQLLEAQKAVEGLKAEVEASNETVKQAQAEFKKLKSVKLGDMDAKGQKAAHESLKAAENNVKAAQKVNKDTKNALAKALQKVKDIEAKAEDAQAAVENATKPPKAAAPKPLSGEDIQKAAAKEGVEQSAPPLKAAEIRDGLAELANSKHEKVAAIGALILAWTNGASTPKLLGEDLAALCDGKKVKKAS